MDGNPGSSIMRPYHYYNGRRSQPTTPQANPFANDPLTMPPAVVWPTGMEASSPDVGYCASMMSVPSNLDVFDRAIQVCGISDLSNDIAWFPF